jgi:hypothetical protein
MKMKNMLFYSIFLVCLLLPAAVSAQLRVTFVTASGGSDANACSRSAPCRQIQRGLSTTTRGGTVVVLDSGEYEPFTITQSVSVVAEKGVSAVVGTASAAAGAAIEEDSTSSQIITIRGLTFVDSDRGISVDANITSLSVEDCSITGADQGIYVGGSGRYALKNIKVSHTPSGVIFAPPPSLRVVATIDDSRFEQIGGTGVEIGGTNASLTIRNSVATYNVNGFLARSNGKMVVENSIISNNTWGIAAENQGSVSVSHSTISYNGTGIRNSSGTYRTFGNNSFSNNTTNTSGSVFSVSQQ